MFVEYLTRQHRDIESKLKSLIKSDEPSESKMRSLLIELQHHMAAEEKYLYPMAEDELNHTERSKLVEHSYKEHTEAKDYIIRLTNTDYLNSQTLKNDLKSLYEELEHHHKDEEEDVFPKLEKKLDAENIKDLSMSLQAYSDSASGFVLQ